MSEFCNFGQDVRKVTEEGSRTVGATVRVEQAGVMGLTSCEFDEVTGKHLSTTHPVEVRYGIFEVSGIIPGVVEDVKVSCPRLRKCDSCPNRKKLN